MAQNYPSKPVRMIVPFTPGGSQDVIARLFAQKLTESFKQQVVIDNRGGAAGLIAAEMVARAPKDGYTLFLITGGPISLAPALHPKLPYDPIKDFSPITQLVDTAIQLNGARGYSGDTPLEWIYRYARQARLVDGASEVHKMVLAKFFMKERGDFWSWK